MVLNHVAERCFSAIAALFNNSIQWTLKSGVSLRYTLLLTAADARR